MIDFEHEVRRVVGEALTEPELRELLPIAYAQLTESVGAALASTLTDDELAEFEQLMDAEDEAAADAWLGAHRPDYTQVIERQLQLLLARLGDVARVTGSVLPA